ncbi:MAG: hypothetical protein N2323_02395 [candidate division WOR-3 bacterium]|nr:hypothetical protein [candidate division WOR-3 bacterium]MCX7836797.1 hypothetical protein [candidate division WOR-3 bacterium]MDW8114659.1 hypothetical protein [candidate division WOR-3 bacterium]
MKKIIKYFKEEFDIDEEVFKDYQFYEYKDNIYIMTEEAKNFDCEKIIRKGIRIARIVKNGIKPTTDGIQIFGYYAKKNIIYLNEEDLKKVLLGQDLHLELEIPEGYKILFYKNYPIGIGYFRNKKLKNQIPRSRRINLIDI